MTISPDVPSRSIETPLPSWPPLPLPLGPLVHTALVDQEKETILLHLQFWGQITKLDPEQFVAYVPLMCIFILCIFIRGDSSATMEQRHCQSQSKWVCARWVQGSGSPGCKWRIGGVYVGRRRAEGGGCVGFWKMRIGTAHWPWMGDLFTNWVNTELQQSLIQQEVSHHYCAPLFHNQGHNGFIMRAAWHDDVLP